MLDGGWHFDGVYECKDSELVSIEPRFYALLHKQAGLTSGDYDAQMDKRSWPALKERLAKIFKTKTRGERGAIMEGADVCFAPVLSILEAVRRPHTVARGLCRAR